MQDLEYSKDSTLTRSASEATERFDRNRTFVVASLALRVSLDLNGATSKAVPAVRF